MKLSTLFLLLSILINLPANAAEPSELSGTWELVNGYIIDSEGKKIAYDLEAMVSRKVLTTTDYGFVSRKGGEFWAASTGTYLVEGNQYTEKPELLSYPLEAGATYTFTFEIEGDHWYTQRFENGKPVEQEHWRRLR